MTMHSYIIARMKSRIGFSLMELLVVIAIVSTLAGLLLPVIGTMRKSAISLSCQNNLRQIGAAMLLYPADYDGHIVPRYNSSVNGKLYPIILNDTGLLPFGYNPLSGREFKITSNFVWQCPSIARRSNSAMLNRLVGAYSTGYGPPEQDSKTNGLGGLSSLSTLLNDIKRRSDCAMMMEVEQYGTGTKTPGPPWYSLWNPPWNDTNHQAGRWRHVGDSTNIVFFDGRVSSLLWTYANTNPNDMFRTSRP